MFRISGIQAMNVEQASGTKQYRDVLEIGRGGMATVSLTVLRRAGGFTKLQVVKRLRPEFVGDPEFVTMFMDEARLSARLNHPNIVQTNEVGVENKVCFIAMEYLEGQPLSAVLQAAAEKDAFTQAMYLKVIVDLLAGLHYAHELTDFDGTPLRVVHRDVSPQNVFVTYDGQIKLLDFGIAKAVDAQTRTQTGVLKGKVAYMPPEQFGNEGVDRRADIYACGVLLWQALSGEKLWKGKAEVEVFKEVANGRTPSPSSVKADVPEKLEAICMKALSFEREHRYQTASEMQLALEGVIEELDLGATHREIGKVVATLFAQERAEVRTIIDQRLRLTENERTASSIPALEKLLGAPEATTRTRLSLPRASSRSRRTMFAAALAVFGMAGVSGAVTHFRSRGTPPDMSPPAVTSSVLVPTASSTTPPTEQTAKPPGSTEHLAVAAPDAGPPRRDGSSGQGRAFSAATSGRGPVHPDPNAGPSSPAHPVTPAPGPSPTPSAPGPKKSVLDTDDPWK